MPTTKDLGQKVKAKYPGIYDSLSDAELGKRVRDKYPDAYGQFVDEPVGVFPVARTSGEQASKKANAQADFAKAQAEATSANSFGGKTKNFFKSLGENIASGEVGLGRNIADIAYAQKNTNDISNINQRVSDTELALLQRINTLKRQGQDTTRLEQTYNAVKGNKVDLPSLPTAGQVAGNIGLSALDAVTAGSAAKGARSFELAKSGTLPVATDIASKTATAFGLPEAASVVRRGASGLLTKEGAKNIGKGAITGYSYDVASGLSGQRGEDRTGMNAFLPGVGTAVGIGFPLASEGVQSIKNNFTKEGKIQKTIQGRQEALNQLDGYQSLKKVVDKNKEKGVDIKKILSEEDVLHNAVDNTGTISTKGEGQAVDEYTKKYIQGNENLVSQALQKEGKSIAPGVVQKKLLKAINESGIEGKALVNARKNILDELAGYEIRANDNGSIPVSTLHDAKVDKYNSVNFLTDAESQRYNKAVGKALKELVEEHTTSVNVKELNKELAKHFAVVDYLEKLDGKKVSGGKVGKYFAQVVGAVAGGTTGGPIGAFVGSEVAKRVKEKSMTKTFGGKTGITQGEGKAITNVKNFVKEKAKGLPAANVKK